MGANSRTLRASLGAIFVVGFFWFLFAGVLADYSTKMTTVTVQSTGNFELFKPIGRGRQGDLALNYVSKRRVPNGPDPIHNRGAGSARQPPNRA